MYKQPEHPKKEDANERARKGGRSAVLEDFDRNIVPFRSDNGAHHGARFTNVSDVEPKPVKWLWHRRLARGKLTIIAGDPGLGKSQITIDIIARLTTGEYWPDGGRPSSAGRCLMISAEDAVADTIRPRLEAAGADLRRVSVLEAIEEEEGERSFNLKQDLAVLQNEIEEFGDVVMMVIDPITSYMGENVDSHRTSDVRAVLEPLAAFAERNNIAVLAVSHPPKAAQAKAINAVTGSSAFVAAARIVLMAIQDPHDEDRRLLLHVKNNLSAEAEGLGYRLMQREITNGIIASYVSWDSEPVDVTVGEAMRAAGSSSEAAEGKLDRAMTFLGEQLSGGPTAPDSVMAKAKGLGIGERTLRTAKKKLGVVSRKNGYGAGWMWELPSVA